MTERESAPDPAVRLQDVALAAVEEICAPGQTASAKQEDRFLHQTAGVVRANGRSLHEALEECVLAPVPEDERLVWLASQLHLSQTELLAVALAAAVEDNPIVGRVLARAIASWRLAPDARLAPHPRARVRHERGLMPTP
jgi:hypothetical protein